MQTSRRHFLASTSAVAAGLGGLRTLLHPSDGYAYAPENNLFGYGPLRSDPEGKIDLPEGFSYRVVSKAGKKMDDGFILPGAPDGMATFPGPNGETILIRNHEVEAGKDAPWGKKNELFQNIDKEKVYDAGDGKTPCCGGTTTVVYDTKKQEVVREFLSLAGTNRNCAGGPTPWNTWITCEETVIPKAKKGEKYAAELPYVAKYTTEKDHGYNFEVPATTQPGLAEPTALIDMGRFNHEAVAVDPKTGIVYQTEDRGDSLIYRFIPNTKGKLADGGKLQALVVREHPSADLRNWNKQITAVGQSLDIAWIDMEDVESPKDDLRLRGFEAGAARFARGEGMWYTAGKIYFACTNGGKTKDGQVFCYTPSEAEGTKDEEKMPARLELFIEPNDSKLLHAADNVTVAPWGDLVLCEDRAELVVRLVGVTPKGQLYTLAMSHLRTEFAGSVFSPDGSTLFVNSQGTGETWAITGPWDRKQV